MTQQNNGKPFQVLSDIGYMIILSPAHADEIRNDERFSFDALLYKMFLGDYSGLEPLVFGTGFHGVVFKSSVRKNLTQSLGTVRS